MAVVAVVDPLPGILAGRAPRVALEAIGRTVAKPDSVICEPQVGGQCGQHAVNNLLQETKCIRVEADPINLIVGPRNECRSIVELLQNRTIKVNMRALCSLNREYCEPPGHDWYSDDGLVYILTNILNYSTESVVPVGRDIQDRINWVNNMVRSLAAVETLGCLLNQSGAHWTAITKYANAARECPGRPYVFLNSMTPENIQCMNENELRQFLHVKFGESRILKSLIVNHRENYSYISIASQRNLDTRRGIVTAAQAALDQRTRRFYELYRKFVSADRNIPYMESHGDEFPVDSKIRPALRTKGITNGMMNNYTSSNISINEFDDLRRGAVAPAAAPAAPPVRAPVAAPPVRVPVAAPPVRAPAAAARAPAPAAAPTPTLTPELRRTRLLEMYAAYTDDRRNLNALKKLAIRDLAEGDIIDALRRADVTDEFIQTYLESDVSVSLTNVENVFSPATTIPKLPPNMSKTRKNSRATNATVPRATAMAPATVPRVNTPAATRSPANIIKQFRKTFKNTNSERKIFERLFNAAKNARSVKNMQGAINYANAELKKRGK